jgi:hypothetical protein
MSKIMEPKIVDLCRCDSLGPVVSEDVKAGHIALMRSSVPAYWISSGA